MVQRDRDVRFVPEADSCTAAIVITAIAGNCEFLLQEIANFRQQLTWAEGLRNVIIAARRSRLLFFPAERIRRGGNDRNRSRL
jgi:hypothetical protein